MASIFDYLYPGNGFLYLVYMRVKLGAIITNIAGSVGGLTASSNKGQFIFANKKVYNKSNMGATKVQRGYFNDLKAAWKALTSEQRFTWSNLQFSVLNGWQHFLQVNLDRLICGYSISPVYTARSQSAIPYDFFMSFAVTEECISFYVPTTFDSGSVLLVFATKGLSPGISNYAMFEKLIAVIPSAVVGFHNLWSSYITKYSVAPAVGSVVQFAVYHVQSSDHYRSQPMRVRCNVLAYQPVLFGSGTASAKLVQSVDGGANFTTIYSDPSFAGFGYLSPISYNKIFMRSTNTAQSLIYNFELGAAVTSQASTYSTPTQLIPQSFLLAFILSGLSVTTALFKSFISVFDSPIFLNSSAGNSALYMLVRYFKGFTMSLGDNKPMVAPYNSSSFVVGTSQFSSTSVTRTCYCGDGIIIACKSNPSLIYRSSDNGSSFDLVFSVGSGSTGFYCTYLGAGVVIASFADTVGPFVIYRSADYGSSWSAVTVVSSVFVTGRHFYLGPGCIALTGSGVSKFYASFDYGVTFQSYSFDPDWGRAFCWYRVSDSLFFISTVSSAYASHIMLWNSVTGSITSVYSDSSNRNISSVIGRLSSPIVF